MNHVTKYFAQIEPDQPLKSPNVFDVALGKLGPGKIIQVSTKDKNFLIFPIFYLN